MPPSRSNQAARVTDASLAATPTYFAATKHDSTNEASTSTGGIWVGTGGNVRAIRPDDTVVNILNVPNGSYLPIVAKRINNTGTTAADIVFLVAQTS